jgi:hypothetical protein
MKKNKNIKKKEEKDGDYFVDIPNSNDPEDSWINLGLFPSKDEAVAYVKETFGGDDEGRIKIISKA